METLNLATIADNLKKPSKSQAQSIVREIFDAMPEASDNIRMAEQLGQLYAYFMPPLPKKPKTAFQWVALAMGNKEIRHYLNYVYVAESDIVATDGHRLHLAPNSDNLEPGFYLKNGEKAHEPTEMQFPEYSRVIPKIEHAKNKHTLESRPEPFELEDGKTMVFTLPCGTAVNAQHFDKALSLDGYPAPVLTIDAHSCIRLDLPAGRLAVIMPVRV